MLLACARVCILVRTNVRINGEQWAATESLCVGMCICVYIYRAIFPSDVPLLLLLLWRTSKHTTRMVRARIWRTEIVTARPANLCALKRHPTHSSSMYANVLFPCRGYASTAAAAATAGSFVCAHVYFVWYTK